MNEKERELRRQKIRRLIKRGGHEIWGYKNVSVQGDNYQHFLVKSAIFKVLQEAGHENVFTEVQFPNNSIADVLDTETAIIYEVETDKTRADVKKKLDDFSYDLIADVFVFDPDDFSDNIEEIRKELKQKLVI